MRILLEVMSNRLERGLVRAGGTSAASKHNLFQIPEGTINV